MQIPGSSSHETITVGHFFGGGGAGLCGGGAEGTPPPGRGVEGGFVGGLTLVSPFLTEMGRGRFVLDIAKSSNHAMLR